MGVLKRYHRDDVFTPGGQPTVTYVDRQATDIERSFAKAVALPNHVVSLSGPTKTGKTVLCKKMLGDREYVWIDGGSVKTDTHFWEVVGHELNQPYEREVAASSETGMSGGIETVVTASGSRLRSRAVTERWRSDTMSAALSVLTQNKILLVIDDFHYIPDVARTAIMRNIKGAVFNGLKVILLSVTHRVFDAIKAESELTGRFTALSLPHWSEIDLSQIPQKGFDALRVDCPQTLISRMCEEAQESPFLMQKFCWEMCFDSGIEHESGILSRQKIPDTYDLDVLFKRLSRDAGLPIYEKLAAGPQSRKVRAKRPLRSGGEADIYQAVLLAIAETGPEAVISYDALRSALNQVLSDQVPQKHEITSALKHLARIARAAGSGSAIDWDDDKRHVNVVDPFLRFYLRWQVRSKKT